MACQKCHILYKRRVSRILMHAEGKKATQTSKAADNEREGVLYLNSLSEAITCNQFGIKHFFKIEASFRIQISYIF